MDRLPTTMVRGAATAITKLGVPALAAHASASEIEAIARAALTAGIATIEQNDCTWWNADTGDYEHITSLATAIDHSPALHHG